MWEVGAWLAKVAHNQGLGGHFLPISDFALAHGMERFCGPSATTWCVRLAVRLYLFFPLMLAFPSVYVSFFFGFVSEVAENWRFPGSSGETTMQEVLQCVSGIGSV